MTIFRYWVMKTGDWEEVASKATCFLFFKCCCSLCRTIAAVFLTTPQKCVSCTETVRISGKHQVKNHVAFSQSLYTCNTCTVCVMLKCIIYYFNEGTRTFLTDSL